MYAISDTTGRIERAWDELDAGPLYANPEQYISMFEEALCCIEVQHGGPVISAAVQDALADEAARRTAAAVALLTEGGFWTTQAPQSRREPS